MVLSLLHQSSLGATYGVLSGRAIWFKPSLPVMFILSAMAGGISMTLLLSIIVGKLRNHRVISRILQFEISRLAGFVLLAYLYLKLWDWAATSYYSHAPGTMEALSRLNATTPYTQTFWWLEIVLGGIIPAIILLYRPLCQNDRYVMVSLGLIVMGVTVNRWNVTSRVLWLLPNGHLAFSVILLLLLIFPPGLKLRLRLASSGTHCWHSASECGIYLFFLWTKVKTSNRNLNSISKETVPFPMGQLVWKKRKPN